MFSCNQQPGQSGAAIKIKGHGSAAKGRFSLGRIFFTPLCNVRKSGRIHGRSGNTGKTPRTPASGGMPFSRAAIQSRTYRHGKRVTPAVREAATPHPPRTVGEREKTSCIKKEAGQAHMAPVRLPAYIESPLCVTQHPYPIAVLQGACSCCSARGRLPVRHRTTPGLPLGTVSLPMRNAPPL